MIPVILAGGSGARVWPLPREEDSKQLLGPLGRYSLFQQAALRMCGEGLEAPVVVCNREHRFVVHEQLTALDIVPQSLVLEPFARNTAPAVAMVALRLLAEGRDELLLVAPSDHVFREDHLLREAVRCAEAAATAGALVLFGAAARYPETRYGYVQCQGGADELGLRQVARFIEKPDMQTACRFVASGEHYWNSGLFLFRASRYLEELKQHEPAVHEACMLALTGSRDNGKVMSIDQAAFACCPDRSIDFAIMERTTCASLMPLGAGWSDAGNWTSLWAAQVKDTQGNMMRGDVLIQDARDNLVHANSRLVTLLGLEDTLIIEHRDAVVVAHRNHLEEVPKRRQTLTTCRDGEAQTPERVSLPWGTSEVVGRGLLHRVRHITVKPGASLPSQRHERQTAHWVVISGVAQVTCDEKSFLLSENQSTFIPAASRCRLSNPGKILLDIIEVQSGGDLDEESTEWLDAVRDRREPAVEPATGIAIRQ